MAIQSNAEFDYSKPLATLLREGTHEAHEAISKGKGATTLTNGHMSKLEYTRYLMMLYHIYDNLERALDKHATHRALDTTYNPTLLARTASISADISHLLEVPEPAWRTHPLHKTLTANPPRPLTAYLGRINELAAASDPTALLAHSYVRYLGDLSGGQIIRHSLAKAYGLDETLCLGLEFYRFKELTTQEWAGHGEMRRIKDWFKEGMNTAGNRDRLIKEIVVAEASKSLYMNADILALIRTPEAEKAMENEVETPRVVAELAPPVEETSYRVSSLIAVIGAVCMAHFLLVVGGFTGKAGYQKLVYFEDWFDQIWQAYVQSK